MNINRVVNKSLYDFARSPLRKEDIIVQAPFYNKKMTQVQLEALKARVLAAFPPKTEDELTAIKMNKSAIQMIKNGVDTHFPDATLQDLFILKNDEIRKYLYQNPNSGNLYHLINKGKDINGHVSLRVLDSRGSFVKELSVKPKKIAVIDNYYNQPSNIEQIPHGEMVEKYLLANNPCIEIARYNCGDEGTPHFKIADVLTAWEDIVEKSKGDKKFDYLNCSFLVNKNIHDYCGSNLDYKMGTERAKAIIENAKNNLDDSYAYSYKLSSFVKDLFENNVRVIQSAGNYGPESFGLDVVFAKTEGVGMLGTDGKILKKSSSRFLGGAKHYELGEFWPVARQKGINITNTTGIDIPFSKDFINIIKTKSYTEILAKQSEIEFCKSIRTIPKELSSKVFKIEDRCSIYGVRMPFTSDKNVYSYKGMLFSENTSEIFLFTKRFIGSSYSAPIRTAKLALNDSLQAELP